MLKPNKHTDPSLSVLNISGLMIEILQENNILTHDDLLTNLTYRTSVNVKEVYNFALSFLYLVGKLEYIPELDALRIPK
jgi:hypothetical protein